MTATEAADNTTTLKINAIYGTVTDMEDPSNWNHVLAFYGFASSATTVLAALSFVSNFPLSMVF